MLLDIIVKLSVTQSGTHTAHQHSSASLSKTSCNLRGTRHVQGAFILRLIEGQLWRAAKS